MNHPHPLPGGVAAGRGGWRGGTDRLPLAERLLHPTTPPTFQTLDKMGTSPCCSVLSLRSLRLGVSSAPGVVPGRVRRVGVYEYVYEHEVHPGAAISDRGGSIRDRDQDQREQRSRLQEIPSLEGWPQAGVGLHEREVLPCSSDDVRRKGIANRIRIPTLVVSGVQRRNYRKTCNIPSRSSEWVCTSTRGQPVAPALYAGGGTCIRSGSGLWSLPAYNARTTGGPLPQNTSSIPSSLPSSTTR